MNTSRPGCLSPLAMLSAVITIALLVLIGIVSGQGMFSPGALNARSGAALGGVASHAEIGKNCAECHPAPWSGATMTERCLDCHAEVKAEITMAEGLHGALSSGSSLVNCRECHTEHRGADGVLTLLDLEDFPHDVMGFSMVKHATRADGAPFTCADCHTLSISEFDQQTCDGCHNEMDAVFAGAHRLDFGSDCLACHDGVDRFGSFDHNQTGFALAGKHVEAACSACHAGAQSAADYATAPLACEGCHLSDDAHDGQFGTDCAACHEPSAWENATFDHSRADFPLDGAHVNVDCENCHKDRVFKGTPTACSGCHAEPAYHAGMFAGQECSVCHTSAAWRPARYDGPHTFPMNHEDASTCADCHQPDLTAWTCYPCHNQAETAAKHQEEGITDFADCLRCHATGQKEEGGGGEGGGDD